MRILITGGTGFIGSRLCAVLTEAGHELVVYSRRPSKVKDICGAKVEALVSLDDIQPDDAFDAVINLAGESIAAKRWSAARKQQLVDSRIHTTQKLLAAMTGMATPPACLISASAVGFYGDQADTGVDEMSTPSDDFGHQLCQQWENEALKAEALGVRVCIVRIGLVVGPNGGFLSKMLMPFKLGLGGHFGTGQQWMSWVHREDLIGVFYWLLTHSDCRGVFNGTSPGAVRNKEFTQTLATMLHRPALLPMPAAVAKVLFGEMALLFLTGQRVVPKRISGAGFEFKYPTLRAALGDVLP